MYNITYQKERLKDIKEELIPLLEEHYREIAAYQDKIKLSPQWETYHTLDEGGFLKISTVRDNGKLVGYYINIVTPSLHYSEDIYATNDIVLIKPKYRNASVGSGLFKFTESWMKELGVSVMSVHMKVKQPFDDLCLKLGWDYTERLYTKCIKEA